MRKSQSIRRPSQNPGACNSLGHSEDVSRRCRAVTSANLRSPTPSPGRILGRGGGVLEDISKTFEWAAVDISMRPLHCSLLLQQWYGLSASGAEEAVRDRLPFRRFCGIPLDDETPDYSSISRFRQRLAKLGLSEMLLAEVNRQFDARRLILGSSTRTKRGTLVDATIIAGAVKPPKVEDGQANPRDPDVSVTKKNEGTYFGYKAHLALDEENGIVRQVKTTSADLNNSQRGETMIQGDEHTYYADKAYESRGLCQRLAELGVDDKIAYKAERNKALVNWRVRFNENGSSLCCGLERVDATMKNW